MTSTIGANITEPIICDQIIATNYEGVTAGICATLCVFGLVYVFFGYRCFSAVMFLSGLIFGGTTVFLMCREERIFQQQFSIEIAAGIAAGIGVLCGFITMLVRYVGLFLQGFFLGLLIAVAGIIALQSVYSPTTAWIPVGILFGTGIIFSLLTLKFQRSFVIISTAVLGGALIAVCIDYFLEQFLLLRYIWEALMAGDSVEVCWYTWVILGVWPILAIAGALLQWKVTSKGFDHTDVIITRGRHKQVRTHLVRETRRPRSQASRSTRQANQSRHAPSSSRRRPTQPSNPPTTTVSRIEEVPQREIPQAARNEQVETENDDGLPTYFECVELGVRQNIKKKNKVVRTGSGAFVSNRNQPASGGVQNDLIQGLSSGAGYSGTQEPTGEPPGPSYVDNAQQRRSQRGNRPSNPEPDRENIERFSRTSGSGRGSSNNSSSSSRGGRAGAGGGQGSKRFKRSPRLQASGRRQGQESDTQRLLAENNRAASNKPRSHGEAVAAHARRIKAVQNRRTSAGRTSGERPQASAPATNGANEV
uniref:Transmembrane protein 198 n=1 Tax=Phallusia mammillata TaxID=59560 RepID=A0A6F9DVR2_9ASCI|nr:transmembrane protein 198 [Phallusia mammillata]